MTKEAPWLVQSALKSPERYGVGITLLVWGVLGVLLIAPWKSAKKNSLSLMMGPPTVAAKLVPLQNGAAAK